MSTQRQYTMTCIMYGWRWRIRPLLYMQAELCHVLFTADVQFTETAEQASTPPSGLTELPTCPVCLGDAETFLPIEHPLTVFSFTLS